MQADTDAARAYALKEEPHPGVLGGLVFMLADEVDRLWAALLAGGGKGWK